MLLSKDHTIIQPILFLIVLCILPTGSFADTYQQAAALVASGDYAGADSVYTKTSLAAKLDFSELLAWAAIKGIKGDLPGAAQLYCRAAAVEPRAAPIVFSQFSSLIKDLDSATVSRALAAFTGCYSSLQRVDTLSLCRFLVRVYFTNKEYSGIAGCVFMINPKVPPAIQWILEQACNLYAKRQYGYSIACANRAYTFAQTPAERSLCASVIYQSYASQAQRDSARVWLSRIVLTSAPMKEAAIVFYQKYRLLALADSLLLTLPPGIMRDTLTLRYMLLHGDWVQAGAYAQSLARETRYPALSPLRLFWLYRTTLFGGNAEQAKIVLDSIAPSPDFAYATEILSHKYAWHTIAASPDAVHDYPSIEYALWSDSTEKAAAILSRTNYTPQATQFFFIAVAKAFINREQYAEASALLAWCAHCSKNAEYRYVNAVALLNLGRKDTAQSILQTIVLEDGQDLYASKARLMLLKLKHAE